MEHACGAEPYVADLTIPGMLHAALVLAQHPRARVLGIDVTAARATAAFERIGGR